MVYLPILLLLFQLLEKQETTARKLQAIRERGGVWVSIWSYCICDWVTRV